MFVTIFQNITKTPKSIVFRVFAGCQFGGLVSCDKGSLEVLRDIDDKVSHSLKLVYDIDVVDTCLVVLAAILDILNLSIAEVVAK